jgi:4-hydroxy 2-oxovalerate aldolase
MEIAGVDIVELGFRFKPKHKFLGPFAYTTDDYLGSFDLPSGIPYAVMVNAKEFVEKEGSISSQVMKLVSRQSDSPIEIVRVAVTIAELSTASEIAYQLGNLGCSVFLNLRQGSAVSSDELCTLGNQISNWGVIDTLYFADSLGSMSPIDTRRIVEDLRVEWEGNIGIHAHNNKQQALVNSLIASEHGVEYCDGTILGMGRGAGSVGDLGTQCT